MIFPVHPRTRAALVRGAVPPLWDGKAADRIADHVISI